MHALTPALENLLDQVLLHSEPSGDDQDFLDALTHAERAGELTREQAMTLGSMLGRTRAETLVRQLGGPP
jgi:hypothetical protein